MEKVKRFFLRPGGGVPTYSDCFCSSTLEGVLAHKGFSAEKIKDGDPRRVDRHVTQQVCPPLPVHMCTCNFPPHTRATTLRLHTHTPKPPQDMDNFYHAMKVARAQRKKIINVPAPPDVCEILLGSASSMASMRSSSSHNSGGRSSQSRSCAPTPAPQTARPSFHGLEETVPSPPSPPSPSIPPLPPSSIPQFAAGA